LGTAVAARVGVVMGFMRRALPLLVPLLLAMALVGAGVWVVVANHRTEAQIQQESHAALDGYLPLCGAARMRPTDICVKIGGDASDNADTFEEVLDKYTAAHSPATLRRMYEHRQWWGSALIALGGLGLAGLLVLALGSRRRGAPAPPA